MAGGELAIMEPLRTPRLSTQATTDRPHIPVFMDHPTTDLRHPAAAGPGHQPMLSAMAPAGAAAVRRLAVILVVQAVRPVRVPLVHVGELPLQAR